MKKSERRLTGPRSFYRRKSKPITIMLTEDGHKALSRVIKRTKKSRNDVVERLIREHGDAVEFKEAESR